MTKLANLSCARDEVVYVKKWIKTSQAIIFKLSNKLVQAWFKDNAEVYIDGKQVTYIDTDGEIRRDLDIATNMDIADLKKRLVYVKARLEKNEKYDKLKRVPLEKKSTS